MTVPGDTADPARLPVLGGAVIRSTGRLHDGGRSEDPLAPDATELHTLRTMLLELLEHERAAFESALAGRDAVSLGERLHGWAGAATYCGTPRLQARLACLRELLPAEPTAAPDWPRVEVHARALWIDLSLLRIALRGRPVNRS